MGLQMGQGCRRSPVCHGRPGWHWSIAHSGKDLPADRRAEPAMRRSVPQRSRDPEWRTAEVPTVVEW